jgi:type I restriction enzyme S subunit
MGGEWPLVNLGDLIEVTTGFPFKSSQYSTNNKGFKLLRGDNVVQGTFRWENVKLWPKTELTDKHNAYWLQENDVILAMDRPWIEAGLKTSQIKKYDIPCLLVQRVASLRATEGLDQNYLRYVISSYWFVEYVKSVQTGTAVPHISPTQIKSFEFKLPSTQEQKAIAHILGSLDDKIQLNRQMNATLEAMAQALFKSWFVDFDPVIDKALAAGNPIPESFHKRAEARKALGKLRKPLPADIAQHFPDRFVFNEEMGWVPDGWKICPLKSITTELRRGILPKYVDVGGVRVVNQKCIRDHTVNYCLTRRNDKTKRKINGRELMVGDVLVNSTGVGTLGRMAQILCLDETTVVDSHVTVVRSNNNIYKPYTFARMILSLEPKIEAMGEGSTGQTELSRANLQEITVLVPPLNCQKGIERILFNNAQKMVDLSKDNELLINLRDTLLPKLLSGQLRIPNAENFFKDA